MGKVGGAIGRAGFGISKRFGLAFPLLADVPWLIRWGGRGPRLSDGGKPCKTRGFLRFFAERSRG
jgi:hypothetical protein